MLIPPEIDELMWGIAEDDTVDAVHEFELRYPKFQQELLRRIKTVKALRAQGKTAPQPGIPIFQARDVKQDTGPLLLVGLGAMVATVVIVGVVFLTRPQVQAPTPPVLISTKAPELTIPEVIKTPEPTLQAPSQVPPEIPKPVENPGSVFDMDLKSAKLHDAINLISAGGLLTANIAPGLENPEVEVHFSQMTAIEMLRQLGKDYAFTPVLEGEREILILPTREVTTEEDGNDVR